MIYLIIMQYIKHRMQMTLKLWKYNLTTICVKIMQQTTSQCQKVTVVFVTDTYYY